MTKNTSLGAGLALVLVFFSSVAQADQVSARCDIYPRGEDHGGTVVPCIFSQRQGYINIDRSDGVAYDLSPKGDRPGNYTDRNGKDVFRNSGLGDKGLIFRLPNETVFVYWDTAGLPEADNVNNYTAPYSTANFDATARISCSLSGLEMAGKVDCAIGINRGLPACQTVIAIMRPDGVERVLQFDAVKVVSPGEGEVRARLVSGIWEISIDNTETYRIPVEAVEGG